MSLVQQIVKINLQGEKPDFVDLDWVGFLPSDRDKDVEETDHGAPLSPAKKVADDGWSNGGVAGLSDPDHASQQHQEPELLKGSRCHGYCQEQHKYYKITF